METRVNIKETEPQAFKAMFALETYISGTSLSKNLKELIKIRASQINGCAYCLDMHTKDAIKNGETQQRIFLLNAWRDAGLFTEEEQVVLEMTEEITLISQKGLTDKTYAKAEEFFDKNAIAHIIMVVVAINSYNRILISTRLQPEM